MSALLPTDTADLRARLLAHPDFSDADRAALVQLLDQQRRYGLVWEDKPEAVEETLRQYLPVLEAVPARALNPDQPAVPQHTLIEGDNLHALTVLSYTHAAQVDVIYIDPPYNTGNKDFIYNDRFVDREDGYRHSKWLSFMAKRLKLAKILLKETGVIFISIDDNEIAQLKLLCDSIFETTSDPSRLNCLGVLIWNLGTGTQAGHFTRSHEYVLAYAKNKFALNNFSGGTGVIDHSALKKISYKNPASTFEFKAGVRFDAKDGIELTGTWGGSEKTTLVSGRMVAEGGKLKYDVVLSAGWAQKGQMKEWFSGAETIDSKGQTVTEFYFNGSGVLKYTKERSVINPKTILQDLGSTKSGSETLKSIIGDNPFDYPKSVELLKSLLRLMSPNALILDFFAGSGTTLHATMALNAEPEGGTRRCILVTNNENNICEQVTYERNRRVIQGYTSTKGVAVPGLAANALRYYRCVAPVPRAPTQRHKRELVRRATDLLCLKEDCYAPLPGLPAGGNVVAFGSPRAATIIVYDDLAVEDAAAFVAALPVPPLAPAGQPWCAVYVFAAASYAYEEEFAAVADRVRLSALPEALYRAWQQLLPPEGAMRTIEEAALAVAPVVPAAGPGASPATATSAVAPAGAPVAATTPQTDKRGNLHLF